MADSVDIINALNLGEEQAYVRELARNFAQFELKPYSAQIDSERKIPANIWARLVELKLLSINLPGEAGGLGYNTLCSATAIEEVARICGSTALSMHAHLNLCGSPILRFGNPTQREKFLSLLASGKAVGALGMTERGAGCDAGSIKTFASRKGEKMIVNGSKTFVINAAEAGVVLISVSTHSKAGAAGISAVIVDGGLSGVSVSHCSEMMGLRGAEWGEFNFIETEIPLTNMLGVQDKGFGIFMDTQLGGRIGTAALALGLSIAALEASVVYARARKQFAKPIGTFQSVANKIADMVVGIEAARNMIYRAAQLRDQNLPHVREASAAKLFATEMCARICSDAIQIHGAVGCTKDHPVERYFRDAKMLEIADGTSEIQRLVISRDVLGKL